MVDSRTSTFTTLMFVLLALSSYSTGQTGPSSDRPSCLNRPKPDGYHARNHVNISTTGYSTSALHSLIVSILLDEVAGVQNNLIVTNSLAVWENIANGDIHACLEYWPSTRAAQEQKYFYDDRTIVSAGPQGVIGSTGWYIPRYVLKDVPTALAGDFANPNVSAYFNNTLIIGDKSWSGPEQDIINDLNYTLTVQYLNGQTAFNALLAERYAKHQPILFWAWRPNMLFNMYDLVRVSIPNSNNYYPSEILGKIMRPTLKDYSPEAAYLVQSYSMSGNDMTAMLGQIYINKTNFEVACQWVTENEQVWENWIRPSSFAEVGLDLQITMWVLTGLCGACAMFYLIVTVKFRKSKVIIASSGLFLVSMCIGGMLMFGSVAAFVSNTDIGCNLFIWMLPVGFALLFGSLFAKTGRIYLLFSNKSLQLVKYTDRDVGLCVGVVLLGEIAVLGVMAGLQPAQFVFQTEGEQQYSFCLFHLPTGITLLVYNGVIIVFGIIIAALVSKLRLTLYNEAKYIGLAMYNFALIAIFVAVIFLVTDVIVRFALLCCCILFLTMASLSVLFIPKIRLLFNHSEEELRQMNEAQLQAVIRSYTKKFASSSDQKTSTNKGTTASSGGTSWKVTSGVPAVGSEFDTEDEMANLASSVKSLHKQVDDLKKENKKLRETTKEDYRDMYEKIYHENMLMKNKIFELEGKLQHYVQNNRPSPEM
jgi:ABC-type proline/glycine betaine transport system substrate-binding protein